MALLSSKLRSASYDGRPAIVWWCPGCSTTHCAMIDAPKGWKFDRNVDAPTLDPSVKVEGGADDGVCHCFIRAGRIEFLNDCTHALRGQVVDMPDLPEGLR